MEREKLTLYAIPLPKALDVDTDSWDPRLGVDNERLTPIEDLKEVRIYHSDHQVMKIGTSLSIEEERDLFDQLIRNTNLFSWAPPDMIG